MSTKKAKIISIINMKGGVGKTTLSVGICSYLSEFYNKKVLLIDSDPQFNSTQAFLDPETYEKSSKDSKTIFKLFEPQTKLFQNTLPKKEDLIISLNKNLDFLCGDLKLVLVNKSSDYQLVKKLKNKNITIIPFGRKAIDFISKKKYNFSESFSKISPEEMNGIAGDISIEIVDKYNNHIYDEVYVIYNKFISALRYDLTCERIIPIARMEAEINSEYIFEPNTEYILSALLPRFINLEVYQAILNNAASEHSARKNSMGSATDNADEMIKTLNIKYNRNRQSAITQEITEIVGGASAL